MKAFTDLEQSKKLEEILPIESADMTYCAITDGVREKMIIKDWQVNIGLDIAIKENLFSYRNGYMVPCWSLAALLEQIPSDLGSSTLTIEKCDSEPFKYGLNYHDRWGREDDIQTKYYDDLVDACYEMIVKLHEQKLL